MTTVYLNDLSPEDPRRNKPLAGAYYMNKGFKILRQVLPSYGIAKSTYNELGDAWTATSLFWWKEE